MPAHVPPPMKSSTRPTASVQRRLFRQQRLLSQMTAYRPLVVLAGIWVGLLAIALLAFSQLTHNASDGQTPASTVDTYPHERLNGATESPSPASEVIGDRDNTPPAETERSAPQTVHGLSVWTLAALVGSCAGGCWLLSMLMKMPRRPKKRRSQRDKSGKTYRLTSREGKSAISSSAPSAAIKSPTVPKLAAYDPQQPLVAPPETYPQSAATEHATEADVALVSDEVQHRLDWPNDSLVNTADVRQRRSLSSYM